MNDIFLITVRHSGTRFFLDMMEKALQCSHHLLEGPNEPNPKRYPFVFAHINNRDLHCIEKYMEMYSPLLITTERNYQDVHESWRKRGRRISLLRENIEIAQCLIQKYSPIIVSVDSIFRDMRLYQLGEALGIKFETDWEPVGQYGDHGKQYDPLGWKST